MRILSGWIGCSGLLLAGFWLAPAFAVERPALFVGMISAGIGLAIICACGAAIRAARGRGAGWALTGALLCACAVRGLWGGATAAPEVELRASSRGQPRGQARFVVVGASVPGRHCRLDVRSVAGGGAFELMAPEDACPLAHGDEIAVASTDLAPRSSVLGRTGRTFFAVDRVYTVRRDTSEAYWHGLARARQWSWVHSRGHPGRAFVAASAIGLVSALPPADRDAVRRSGLGHLIAISGMHVGFLAIVVQRLGQRVLAPLGLGPRAAIALSWIPIVAYVVATGMAAPAIRAAAMLAVVGAGASVGRPTHGLTVLAMAAVGMLFVAPDWAGDPGFHLSVAAMAALVRMPAAASVVRLTWQLQWAVLPVALVHFGPPAAGVVVANLLGLPLFTAWILPAAAIGTLGIPWFGAAALDPAAAGAEILLSLAARLGAWPVVPGWLLASLAALALAARVFLKRSNTRDAIAPPFLAAAGVLFVLAIGSRRASPAPAARWFAIGGPQRPTIVTVAKDGVACIRDPGGNPRRWPDRLDALHVDRVAHIEWTGRIPASGDDPPHIAEFRAELARSDRLAPANPLACEFPEAERVVRAVRVCGRMRRSTVGGAAVGPHGAWCWARGQWHAVQLVSQGAAR